MRPVKSWPAWSRNLLWISAAFAGLFILFRWMMPVVLPFAIALAMARLMEPGVRFMLEHWRVPRKAGSALLTLLLVAALLTLTGFLLSWLFREVNDLIDRAPAMIAKLPEVSETLSERFDRWIEAAPYSLRDSLRSAADGVLAGGASVPAAVVQKLTGWAGSFAAALPRLVLFLFAVVLSTFFISSDYPRIVEWILKPFPSNARKKILSVKTRIVNTMGKWFKAQLLMMLITFGELLTGFLLLRVGAALLPAAMIALVDALPVLGSGICLIPWAIGCLITGDTTRAIGLMILYGTVALTRGFIEPKLVGSQLGLPALATFMAMYTGFVTVGVTGMILFPILLITGKQLFASRIPQAEKKYIDK